MTGGSKGDSIYGGGGNDILKGKDGDDYLEGNAGDDYLYGDDDDTIHGKGGNDIVYGSSGNDTLDGGDMLNYSIIKKGVTVDLGKTGAQDTKGAGTDRLLDFEKLHGSNHNDELFASDNGNYIQGGKGNDVI